MRALHEDFEAQGVTVIGFPCNQFGGQEPGSDAEVQAFARDRFGATFPLSTKIEVNGAGADPLYAFLKAAQARPDGEADIAWNFTKFLVDPDGNVVARYEPQTTPEEIRADLEARLAE